MAEFSVTAANVIASATPVSLVAGEAIAAGELIYLKAGDGKAWLAQSDGTASEAAVLGMAVNNAAAGQPVSYVTSGTITAQAGIFTTPGIGQLLVLGPTAGAFELASDLDAELDSFVSFIGWTTGTATMTLSIKNTGVQRPAA